MTGKEFADRLTQRLMQELTADGIHHDDWPDAEYPVTEMFDLIDEVRKEIK